MQDALSLHDACVVMKPHEPTQKGPQRPSTRRPNTAPPAAPRVRSTDLLGTANEVEIQHGDALYRLRLTALGKLILTK